MFNEKVIDLFKKSKSDSKKNYFSKREVMYLIVKVFYRRIFCLRFFHPSEIFNDKEYIFNH